jgi:hypothetical protein
MTTLRRTAQKDELEMARPRVARGEAAVWSARVDPKAFPEVKDPSLHPAPIAPPPPPANRWGQFGAAAALLLAALGFGALVREKTRRVEASCAARAVRPRPLFALASLGAWASRARALLAGAAFATGIACEALGAPTWGAAAIVLAMALSTFRTPHARTKVRGPGAWLALAPAEAFTAARDEDALDARTRLGKITLAVIALVAAAIALALRGIDAEWPYLVAIDALALVPIFVTGVAAQLPPDAARAGIPVLSKLYRLLRKDQAIRVAPWARIPVGSDRADELRLLVVPRASMPGLTGIEVGLAWQRTANGYASATEVLVRVHDATAASARMTTLLPRARTVPGRKPDERVVRVAPASPGRRATAALVRRLARELVDRRMAIAAPATAPWRGVERRIPPNERAKDVRSQAGAAAAA